MFWIKPKETAIDCVDTAVDSGSSAHLARLMDGLHSIPATGPVHRMHILVLYNVVVLDQFQPFIHLADIGILL